MRRIIVLSSLMIANVCFGVPVIEVDPNSLNFSAVEGESNPDAQVLYISNIGTGKLEWEITETCEWLSIDILNGSLSPNEIAEITINIDIEVLKAGFYYAEITISSIDGGDIPEIVDVFLFVGDNDGTLWVTDEYETIQEAINIAVDGEVVVVRDGVFKGDGNRDIDFLGKAITVRSENGPDGCIVDCEGNSNEHHRCFQFHRTEGRDSVLDGFTLTNGYVESGGGIYCDEGSPTIINCVFNNNSSNYSGGGLYCIGSSLKLINCSFVENSAVSYGGAMYQGSSSPEVNDCIFTFNYAGFFGGSIYSEWCSNHNITNCTFSNNCTDYSGGGLYFHASDPTIANCGFLSNTTSGGGGGIFLNYYSDAKLMNCIFSDNYALAGGAITCEWSYPTITNCTLISNNAINCGGGMYSYISNPAIMNSIFIENSSVEEGGGLYSNKSNPKITNCTFFNNESGTGGCLYYYNNSNAVMANSIMQANIPKEIVLGYYSSAAVNYCNITGGWEGIGNINVDPKFVDAGAGDYHLQWDSPCVDAGDPAFAGEPDETDIDDEPRVMGWRVDIGADEVGPKQSDFTRDGIINTDDFSVLSNSWQTTPVDESWYILSDLWEDGLIDLTDLAVFIEDWLWEADWH